MAKPMQNKVDLPRAQRGFTLVSVLISFLVLSFGLLAIGKTYVALVVGATQNQNISSLAALGNEFWGAVQATPGVLDTLAIDNMPKVYRGTDAADARANQPQALRSWLAHLFRVIPDATVTVTTGTGCSSTAGCAVQVRVAWSQSQGASRSQDFFYQFL